MPAQRIDFWANAQSTGEWVLETALALEGGIDFEAVMFAARLLEDYAVHTEEKVAPQFYKNLVRCAVVEGPRGGGGRHAHCLWPALADAMWCCAGAGLGVRSVRAGSRRGS